VYTFCNGKSIITKHCECILASVIRHANRILSASYFVVFGLFGSTLFFHISHKRHDVWEKISVRVVCFDFPYNFV
jgi:hypothetical protein